MQKLPLDLVRPGMVLEKPVLRDNGLVLVAKGTEISDTLLKRLENMDVKSVTVEGHPVEIEGQAAPKSYQERIDSLDYLFRRFQDDPWMNKMKKFIRSYFARKLASEQNAANADEKKASQARAASGKK